ncbi:Receptor-type guanylate cyclase gcy [Seminavis robusta]|uniref:Receptor-type guanylate cyclase gcy n=1 Tax=Seminavis robusta TaxID=568900 RepID=A0A9N8EN77_9STRA|nr:Receptor-type guanylate cyclase gcy [Seminavis robusta]|eukprot:Sro1373_g267270.1 Receptor-type guanylate cyclase gcy (1164) ;mRNA; r:21112-25739
MTKKDLDDDDSVLSFSDEPGETTAKSMTSATGTGSETLSDSDVLKSSLTDGKHAMCFRFLLLGVLVVVAVVVTTFLYFYLSNSEQADFEDHFESESDKVFSAIGRTLDQRMGNADAYMYRAVSYSMAVGKQWPYAVQADHCVQSSKLLMQIKSFVIQYFPYIATKEDRLKWENFVPENRWWVEECLDVQEQDPNFHGPILREYDLVDIIFNSTGLMPEDAPGPFMPNWLVHPVIPYWTPYNWNAVVYEEYRVPLLAAMDSLSVVYTPLINYAPPDDPARIASAATTNGWAKDFIDNEDDPSEPLSAMYYPVHDAVKNVVVNSTKGVNALGVLAFNFYWRHVMEEILAEGSPGVTAVFKNECGNQSFSYLIKGSEPSFLGHIDAHDGEYESMCQSRPLFDLSNLDGRYSGRPINAEFCPFEVTLCPTQEMEGVFVTNNPTIYAVAAAFVFLFLITTIVFLLYAMEITRRQKITLAKALQARNIVNDVFPAIIRNRMLEQEQEANIGGYTSNKQRVKSFLNSGTGTEAGALGKPIADLYTSTTIMFADVAGFTPWSSTRDPGQVFTFLQTIYQGFDAIAHRRKVFKVETVGDCYVAVCGLPDANKRHAVVMAHFAQECLFKFNELTRKLEIQLGPDTGDMMLRIGLNSGPCTAGVLRGDRARFQLFGNTVNLASRMESHGLPNKIHLSKATADLLVKEGKGTWITPNQATVHVKGKGVQETFWLVPTSKYVVSTASVRSQDTSEGKASRKTTRLIEWNVQVLSNLLKPVVARRNAVQAAQKNNRLSSKKGDLRLEGAKSGRRPLDEVQDVLKLPTFDDKAASLELDPQTIALEPIVIEQLRRLVTEISKLYHDNPFHNFEHASHVASSVSKLLKRIVAPDIEVSNDEGAALGLHDYSYGITGDPLTQFAVVLSALIHDVDHRGVSNMQLGKEQPDLADHYNNKSLAEQNSVDIAWELLMRNEYRELRACIYGDSEEDMRRFRKIVVAVVLATDIFDKELNDLRKGRWTKAFSKDPLEDDSSRKDFKATIVIEHLIQASDVSHTMQHWHVYRKWNERLFLEMYHAYKEGRMGKDPATFWAAGEIGFFDNYIIPLAAKLKECNVFGVSSDEYLNYALENREEWARKGEGIVEDLKKKYTAIENEGSSSSQMLSALVESADDLDDISV